MTVRNASSLPVVFGSLIVIGVIVFSSALFMQAQANHVTSGDDMIYGYVTDGVTPLAGANIKYCWDATITPDTLSCSYLSAGTTDSEGHFWLPFPAAGSYVFWAENNGMLSQDEYIFYSGSVQIPISDLIIHTTGGSGPSNIVPAPPSPPIPSPPPTDTTVSLTWTDYADNEDSYEIERAIAGTGSWIPLGNLFANATTYFDSTVTAGVFYDYRVRACLAGLGCSGYGVLWSVSASGSTMPPPESGGNTGMISGIVFKDAVGVGGILIKLYESGFGFLTSTRTSSDGSYLFTGLTLERTHKVKALPTLGLEPPDMFRTPSVGIPSQVANFQLGGVASEVTSFTISGTVRLSSGAAVADAVVGAYTPATGDFRSGNTDSSGRYKIGVPCGSWDLSVHPVASTDASWYYSDFGQKPNAFFGCDSASGSEVRDFEVIASDASVIGRVLYPDGSVPPNDVVFVNFWSDLTSGFGGQLDSNGNFNILGTSGVYEFNIFSQNSDYFAPTLGDVELFSGLVKDLGTITLVEASASVSGLVKTATGAGVAGVIIRAHMPEGSGFAEVETLTDGSYNMALIPGVWEINAEPDSSLNIAIPNANMRLELVSGQSISGIDFESIETDAVITGRIISAGGVQINGVFGWIHAEDFGASADGGEFTLSVPAGTYTINAWLPPESGFFSAGPKTVTVASGGTISVDIVALSAEGGGRIEGRIIDGSGALVRNIDLNVFAGSDYNWVPGVVDGPSGTYYINVPPGMWFTGVDVFSDDFAARGGAEFTVGVGQVITYDFVLVRATATIEVHVKKSDGTKFPYVGVEASPFAIKAVANDMGGLGGEFFNGFLSDADSSGVARIAVPAGIYYIRSFAGDNSNLISPPEREVVISGGETKNVVLTFRDADAKITGRVLVSETGAAADAFVGAWSSTGGLVEADTDAQGFYSLDVTGDDSWFIKSFGNVGGTLYEAGPMEISAIGFGGTVTQNLLLKSSGFTIPAPFMTAHKVDSPFAATLDNGTAVSASPNTFGTTGNVSIAITPNIDAPEYGGTSVIGISYDVEARGSAGELVRTLNGNILLSIPYTQDDIVALGITEGDIQIGFVDDTTGQWVRLDSSIVDTDKNVVTATSPHLTRFALLTPAYASVVGPTILEGDLIRGPDGVKVWIVNAYGFKRHIFNPAVFGMYGHFVWDNIVEVSQTTLDAYVTSDLYRASGDERVFALEEVDEAAGLANKRWLDMTPERFVVAGYDWLQIFEINPVERDFYQEGAPIQ